MIRIEDVRNIHAEIETITVPSEKDLTINANGLTIFPGLIDPHVHFRTPGMEYKEDWCTAAKAAIAGGYTTVFDMPNTLPPTITATLLKEKKSLIEQQLKSVGIPLRYELYFGADKNHLDQIPLISKEVIGIKVFMGCSTGNLVIDDDVSLEKVFELAAKNNLIVAVHAEDEARIKSRKNQITAKTYSDHTHIRDIETAVIAVAKAIALSKKYDVKLYVLHASSAAELALIRAAKAEGLKVYAETTPHHLFLDETLYPIIKGKAVVNPPLRDPAQKTAVLAAILDGTIDTIGSDHAPHTIDEKSQPYGQCPSGMPGIETTIPLLLEAYHCGLISLHKIVAITATNAQRIFNLTPTNDHVLVDLNKKQEVIESNLKTKCKWSAFAGKVLRGWPVYTIINGVSFDLTKLK